MNFRQYLLAVVTGLSMLFNFSCAGKSDSSAEVVFDDGYKTTAKNEIIIDDSTFGQTSQLSFKQEAHQEKSVTLKDESVLNVMYDAFGNKVETREFPKDSRLLLLTVTTSAKGNRQIIVRGRSGEYKVLPETMLDRVLTTDADEIAHTAGIFQTNREIYLPPVMAMEQGQPKQTYQPVRLPQVPQLSEEAVKEENPSGQTDSKNAEQKLEKVEEKSQPQQNSPQKDSTQPVAPKRKDTDKQ